MATRQDRALAALLKRKQTTAAIKRDKQRFQRERAGVRKTPQRQFMQRAPGGTITSENHYFDTERVSTIIPYSLSTWAGAALDPNTSAMLCLFAPTTGNAISDRIARRIFVKKIRIVGQIWVAPQAAGTTGLDGVNIRMVVFEDQQTNAAQATGDLVLSQGAASDAISMGMSTSNFGRFRILKDKRISFSLGDYSGLTGAYVSQGRVRPFKMSLKINKFVHYNSTNGGTVADVIDNSYHFMALTSFNTYVSRISYKARTTFSP